MNIRICRHSVSDYAQDLILKYHSLSYMPNVELTDAARLYRAASSERRERG